MQETWKDIPGYEGIYQASTFGRIRTIEGKTTFSVRHGERHWKSRILKPKGCKDPRLIGYRVSLWKDKKPHDYLVARLVAATFLGVDIHTKLTVNHKDGNRLNNAISNLEMLTHSQNITYGYQNGQYTQYKTTFIDNSTGEVMEFLSTAKAAEHFGVSSGVISNRCNTGNPFRSKDGREYLVSRELQLSIKQKLYS